ncbi:unnamed protein product [Urochloa humidicola]
MAAAAGSRHPRASTAPTGASGAAARRADPCLGIAATDPGAASGASGGARRRRCAEAGGSPRRGSDLGASDGPTRVAGRDVRGQQRCVGASGGLGSSAVVAAARSPATAWVTAARGETAAAALFSCSPLPWSSYHTPISWRTARLPHDQIPVPTPHPRLAAHPLA